MPEKLEIKPKDKEILTRMLSALYPGVKIYLFGSYARGVATISSDIDLALDYPTRSLTGLEIVMAKNMVEAFNITCIVDIVDFKRLPDYLKEIILKEGVEWKN